MGDVCIRSGDKLQPNVGCFFGGLLLRVPFSVGILLLRTGLSSQLELFRFSIEADVAAWFSDEMMPAVTHILYFGFAKTGQRLQTLCCLSQAQKVFFYKRTFLTWQMRSDDNGEDPVEGRI